MKQVKKVLFSALLTLLSFGAITYISCTKSSSCSGTTCLNGGACNNGSCQCPSGYTGDDCGSPITSSITYKNDTYTPVTIIANGAKSVIAVGGSVTYNGLYGNPLNVSANTYGTGPSGTAAVGDTISWNLSETFPQSGSVTYGIDVDSNFFYLKVQNNDTAYSGQGLYVNYAKPAQSYNNISIPDNRTLYGIGYFPIFHNTEIYITEANPGTSFWSATPFATTTFTANQSYTFILN